MQALQDNDFKAELTMKTIVVAIVALFLAGCGVSQKEYEDLKRENDQLKTEIDELKNGPDRLLGQAKDLLNEKQFEESKEILTKLINKHSGTSQASEARDLISKVDKMIEDEIKKRDAERARLEREEKQRLANATKKLRTKYDDIRGITWYYDRGTPVYTDYNSFHLYMGKEKSGPPWLRFRIQYTADDWLFIESYIIKTDNNSYTIPTKFGEVETDHGSGAIWEWYDVALDSKLYEIVKDVITSKTVKLRHNGKQYYRDRTITSTEKQGLRNILDAYEALGGRMNFSN